MTPPTEIDTKEIQNGSDAFTFLSQFQFWEVTHSSYGRVFLTIRNKKGDYVKFWSRKNESVLQIIERARIRIVQNEISEQTNGANDGQ